MGDPVEGLVPLKEGLLQGYQTMDGLGGFIPTFALVCAAAAYGYTDKKEATKLLRHSSILGAILLGLVYGGLTLLGATTSGAAEYSGLEQAPLLILITKTLLGTVGQTLLSITVLMACLTTAIALTGAGADHFTKLFKGKGKTGVYRDRDCRVQLHSFQHRSDQHHQHLRTDLERSVPADDCPGCHDGLRRYAQEQTCSRLWRVYGAGLQCLGSLRAHTGNGRGGSIWFVRIRLDCTGCRRLRDRLLCQGSSLG